MKTIVINADPKIKQEIGKLLKSAAEGAESVGSEVEYFDLYKIDMKGCMLCSICKKKNKESFKCYWRDDLSPIIEKILDADTLLIGSQIFFNEPTSHYRALLERLIFCILSYDNHSSYYKGKVNVALFYTMNAPKDYYETMMKQYLESSAQVFNMLNGEVEIYPVFNTLQVNDYSKYSMAAFDEKNKKLNHEKQFPIDLETAFEIGARLSK